MINTFHTSLPPPPVPPRMIHGRPEPRKNHTGLLWFVSVVLVLHILLTFVGFIYLFYKGNQASLQGGEFHEKYLDDFLILKRLQKCDDDQLDDQSLLDCKRLLDTFRNVMAKAIAMLTAEQFHGALAHMSVSNTRQKPCTGGKDKTMCVLEWNAEHSVMVNVDTVKDSRITIQYPGYYYVYSQVTFSINNSNEPLKNTIRHVKRKDNTNKYLSPEESDEILLSTYCAPKSMPFCTASQGGVFKLEQGEELYVSVNNLSWVSYDWNSTFFGLYKL
ncbi:hypothetical protein ACEWY4_026693 [Coilia grayii]|uniref:THD domain-containing protein n=1 Tax=Coilia grayii TaxID=363190 RepID=A0ABD1IQ96_9TELE